MKQIISTLVLLLLCVGLVSAINEPTGSVISESNEGSIIESTGNTVVAKGGEVSDLAIYSDMSTDRWQGFVGNVSGDLNLGRGNDVLFGFDDAEIDTVFTTTSTSFNWGLLETSTPSQVDNAWDFTDGADQAIDAFTGFGIIEENTVPIAVMGGNESFICGLFDDGSNLSKDNFAFGAKIIPATEGFDGNLYEYELMVPTITGSEETYYFYMSLAE